MQGVTIARFCGIVIAEGILVFPVGLSVISSMLIGVIRARQRTASYLRGFSK